MKIALTIAASDSSSGAGVQADLAVFAEVGVYGVCALTNITAQNSQGVQKIAKVPPRIIAAQIDSVSRDFHVDACKIGMLYFPQAVETVAERLARREIPNVVLDPVMAAKRGEPLLTEPAIKRMQRRLIPKVRLITPNAVEAEKLTGVVVDSVNGARDAARALVDIGAGAALVKGGHLQGEPIDIFWDGVEFEEFHGVRLARTMHGTGCVLSAAIAARLAAGDELRTAVGFAKQFVTQAIERSVRLGKGQLDYFITA